MPFMGVERKQWDVVKKRVAIGEFNDGSPVSIPVVTITGQRDGPTVYIQGGVHGDEVTGIEAARQLIAGLKPDELTGSVVIVPIANVPAYMSRSRGWSLEERYFGEANRLFPGSTVGMMSERTAYALYNEFILHADLTIDLHTSIDGFNSFPFARVLPDDGDGTYELRKRLAYTFGAPSVWDIIPISSDGDISRTGLPNRFGGSGSKAGKPYFLFEFGESRRVSSEYVPMAVRGVRRLLQVMGNLSGEPEKLKEPQRVFNRVTFVQPNHGGAIRFAVKLGEDVKKGQLICQILDVFGDVVEDVVSPVDGFVMRLFMLDSSATGVEAAWIAH